MLTELNYRGLKQALNDGVAVDPQLQAAILNASEKTEDDLRRDLIEELERPVELKDSPWKTPSP